MLATSDLLSAMLFLIYSVLQKDSKAGQKRAQWKARAKASPTELSSSDLSFYLQQAVKS